jgi:hypothetical protein
MIYMDVVATTRSIEQMAFRFPIKRVADGARAEVTKLRQFAGPAILAAGSVIALASRNCHS